jgi:ribonuclease HI
MLIAHIDGSGKGKYAFVIEKAGEIFKFGIFKKANITNNQAEYLALIEVLKRFPKQDLLIYSDSKLLVNQMNFEYHIKNKKLKILAEQALKMMKGRNVKIKWIPRKYNKAGKLLG